MKKKEIIVCILAIIMLVVSVTNVFAMDDINNLDDDLSLDPLNNNVSTNSDDEILNYIEINNNANKDAAITVRNNTVNANIPDTGIADTPIIPIVICVISAVIAYTQIRKYNV